MSDDRRWTLEFVGTPVRDPYENNARVIGPPVICNGVSKPDEPVDVVPANSSSPELLAFLDAFDAHMVSSVSRRTLGPMLQARAALRVAMKAGAKEMHRPLDNA